MLARIAFVNMMRAAWRDPLWALGCAVFGPLAAIHYVAKVGAIAGIVTLVLLFRGQNKSCSKSYAKVERRMNLRREPA